MPYFHCSTGRSSYLKYVTKNKQTKLKIKNNDPAFIKWGGGEGEIFRYETFFLLYKSDLSYIPPPSSILNRYQHSELLASK